MPPLLLLLLIPAIAFLYASVGFGGASGYLAAMSLFSLAPNLMSSTALVLNAIVSAISFTIFFRAGHFVPRLLWPFLLASVPASFVGGWLRVPVRYFLILLYGTLTYVALRMLFPASEAEAGPRADRLIPLGVALATGTAIGLLSGIIGIGGGIFLSPLIILARWGAPKEAAASAAGFIFVNSVSGLGGRLAGGNIEIGAWGLSLLPLGILGALAGSRLGAQHISGTAAQRLLGVVLLLAVARFWRGLFG